ncbi:MAG: imidazole glycerol phosphate synthase subunit HisH [Clostridiales Family XIII bacterium]|jgi:glutamine amidotransferase|nr:imidazole glycerol phosphate synthase subunit HisH [Clostridiales Family XIII bacterium]
MAEKTEQKIAMIDYGAGNLFSVNNALEKLGFSCEITHDSDVIRGADKLILPGVGAIPDSMRMLHGRGLVDVIREEAVKKPFLGICVGMQLLFEKGYEFEETDCLGLIDGYVDIIEAPGLKVPHIGWSDLAVVNPCELTKAVKDGDRVYFVHSYKANTGEENISLQTIYGQVIPALVRKGTIFGTQFHPEKSGPLGLSIIKSFLEMANA